MKYGSQSGKLNIKLLQTPKMRSNQSIFYKKPKNIDFMEKIKEKGQEKKRYFDTYLPSPRFNQNINSANATHLQSQADRKLSFNTTQIQTSQEKVRNKLISQQSSGLHHKIKTANMNHRQMSFFSKRQNNEAQISQMHQSLGTQNSHDKTASEYYQPLTSQQSFGMQASTPKIQSSMMKTQNSFHNVKDIYDMGVNKIALRKQLLHAQRLELEKKIKGRGSLRVSRSSQLLFPMTSHTTVPRNNSLLNSQENTTHNF